MDNSDQIVEALGLLNNCTDCNKLIGWGRSVCLGCFIVYRELGVKRW